MNYQETKKALRDYIVAGIPFVTVQSVDRHRPERMVREIAQENGFDMFLYTDARQVVHLGPEARMPVDVHSDPLPYLNDLFQKSQNCIFVLGDTHKIDVDGAYTRELLSAVYLAKETGNTIVTVAAEPVWQRLSRFGLCLHLDLPDHRERRALVDDFCARHPGNVSWSDHDCERMATLVRGLAEAQVMNLLEASLVAQGALGSSDVFSVASQKELLFAAVPNVDPVACKPGLEVAGLNTFKEWLDRKREVFFAPSDLLEQYELHTPKGVLLVGVPGCGKSFSAKMVASRWELPLLRFDMGSVYAKYVGETERRMQEALDYIGNVAPCVLWVDEIEKALASSSDESDVGKRVLGQFLFWLQESPAKVFLVATANDVSKLPPELFRKGRFSEVFFVDLPNRAERAEALRHYCKTSLHQEFSRQRRASRIRTSSSPSKTMPSALRLGMLRLPMQVPWQRTSTRWCLFPRRMRVLLRFALGAESTLFLLRSLLLLCCVAASCKQMLACRRRFENLRSSSFIVSASRSWCRPGAFRLDATSAQQGRAPRKAAP